MASPLLQTDLLHPLAKLHWTRYNPPWKLEHPTHCAALQNTVAIVTDQGSLFISSTDHLSWTQTITPYKVMSLTTYQSMFVLVGGRDRSTYEPTDAVLTSTTGLQWEASLPSMPTRRYEVSAVSTKSPEALVVAGGCGSYGKELSTVEVLLEDKWTPVDLLPMPEYRMKSTFHDGNLHFMGGLNQNTKVYTCNCSSLISSVIESTSNTSTYSPLWRHYHQAPGSKTTAVSYCSRLANIDSQGNVKGYSYTTESWVNVASTGDYVGHGYNIAAAVLGTEDILFCHDRGIYRAIVSVSPYSLDIGFPHNVLAKLEAVMNIEIVSVLAKLHSPLTKSSGMKLQPRYDDSSIKVALPNPHEHPAQYVVELIFQWSSGRGHRPPTWRQLLIVLQDIGLVQLSQHIDEFMKDLDHSLCCRVIMQSLYNEFPSSKAGELGVYLDIPPARLEEISHNNPRDCKKVMQDVINYWLENDKEKSWMKLAGAVQTCGHAFLADTIRSEYGALRSTPSTT